MTEYADPAILQETITDEIFKAIGLPHTGRLRRALGSLFAGPTGRFARLMAHIDRQVAVAGFPAGAAELAKHFTRAVEVYGGEHLPAAGPLIVACNHPGAFDSVVLSAAIGREDLKIIATGAYFLRHLPAVAGHLFLIREDQPHDRVAAFRGSLRHLQAGGSLLLFASGTIDPDPAVLPGAEQALRDWSASLEIFARRVDGLQVVPGIIRGVMDPGWAHSPLVRFRRGMERRRLSEFFQMMDQLLRPGKILLAPRVDFGKVMAGGNGLLDLLAVEARRLLAEQGKKQGQDTQD